MDVDLGQLQLDVAEGPLRRPAARSRDVVGAVVGGRQALDETGRVAAFGKGLAVAPGQQAGAQAADLAPRVVDVVLPGDLPATAVEQPADSVAVGGPPAVADVQRAGRVGGDELDLDPLPWPRSRRA